MRYRWLSTFTVIGVLLIVLGIVGLAMGHNKFVYDPGQAPDGNEPWYYLIVGALMIVNGILTPPAALDAKTEKNETEPPAGDTDPDAPKRRSHRLTATADKSVNE